MKIYVENIDLKQYLHADGGFYWFPAEKSKLESNRNGSLTDSHFSCSSGRVKPRKSSEPEISF